MPQTESVNREQSEQPVGHSRPGTSGTSEAQPKRGPVPTRGKSRKPSRLQAVFSDELAVLALIKNGADIYDRGIAGKLREIKAKRPDLLKICAALDPPADGAKRQPYFGAILTAAGRDAVRRFIR